jgi:uncharacterized coiled-coil protein SlyX
MKKWEDLKTIEELNERVRKDYYRIGYVAKDLAALSENLEAMRELVAALNREVFKGKENEDFNVKEDMKPEDLPF